MNVRSALRIALLVQWFGIFMYTMMSGALSETLPIQLQIYLQATWAEGPSTFEYFVLAASMPLLLIYLASSVGLFVLRQWAVRVYIFCGMALVLLSALLSPLVEHSFIVAIGNIETICFGFVTAVLLFTNVVDMNVEVKRV